jgi:hypothetical protein
MTSQFRVLRIAREKAVCWWEMSLTDAAGNESVGTEQSLVMQLPEVRRARARHRARCITAHIVSIASPCAILAIPGDIDIPATYAGVNVVLWMLAFNIDERYLNPHLVRISRTFGTIALVFASLGIDQHYFGYLLFSGVSLWAVHPLVARATGIPRILAHNNTHLVGDVLYEITDHDAVLLAAEQKITSIEQTLRGRQAQLTQLATARRALLLRAGLPDDGPVARMEQLAAEQDGLLLQLAGARAQLGERKADLERRVQEVRNQAELVWQTHQLASVERATADAAVPVIGAIFDVSDVQDDLARILEAAERGAAAWRAEAEVAAL